MSRLYLITSIFTPLLLMTSMAGAVTANDNAIRNKAIFGIKFGSEGQAFYSRENGVVSIAKHEYVTATFKVIEVNIVTEGKALLRIYHTRSLRVGELESALGNAASSTGIPGVAARPPLPAAVQEMADRASRPLKTLADTTVIKEYPIATHAHTIEYRISDEDELLELFEELRKRWLKEPVLTEDGQTITETSEGTETSTKQRLYTLGGTLFSVSS
ncbi:MAG: hypothetical protein AAF546_00930 [Verrucomicrobiota bacterium]